MNKKSLHIVAVLLTLLQFIGGTLGEAGVVFASFYVLFYISYSKHVDIFIVFILLIPGIAFRNNDHFIGNTYTQYAEISYYKFYVTSLVNTVIVGPLAVSTKLFAALAVPIRFIIKYKRINNIKLLFLWISTLIFSLIGLFVSYKNGLSNDSGLTVGLRIVLSMGALLLPLNTSISKLQSELIIVIKLSVILFLTGFLTEHWIFVTAAMPPILIFYEKKKIWRLLGIVAFAILMYYGSAITIKYTAMLSLLLIISKNNRFIMKISKSYYSRYMIYLAPIILVFILSDISHKIFVSPKNKIFTERVYNKINSDRSPIWNNTLDLIFTSNYFIVPAGRPLFISFVPNSTKSVEWQSGAHNIYLEIGRQLGLFSAISILFLIGYHFLAILKSQKSNKRFLSYYFYAMMAVYLVFGLTGNSLVYDGVGFLYWLIIGQIYQIIKNSNNNESSSTINSV